MELDLRMDWRILWSNGFLVALVAVAALAVPSGPFGRCESGSRIRPSPDGNWIACDGSRFIPRGINLQYGDNPNSALAAVEPIAGTGANAVRVQLRSFTTGEQIRQVLEETLKHKMLVMLMLWDGSTTCGSDVNKLFPLLDLWESDDWKSVIQDEKYAPYVLVNIVNEWSNVNEVSRERFRDVYVAAIEKIRTAGYTHPLSIDGFHCGQYPDTFTYVPAEESTSIAEQLLAADPLKNLVFTVHGYAEKWGTDEKISENVDNMMSAGYPWMITEHGCSYAPGFDKTNHLEYWRKTHEVGAGVIAWSWHGNGEEALDMSHEYAPFDPSAYGKDVVDGPSGIKETSVLCSCFDL